MTKKLTLTIEESVIERGKKYAKGTQRSLSEMVQKYLENLGEPEQPIFSTKINRLAGSLRMDKNYTDEELDAFRREYLEEKYG